MWTCPFKYDNLIGVLNLFARSNILDPLTICDASKVRINVVWLVSTTDFWTPSLDENFLNSFSYIYNNRPESIDPNLSVSSNF